MTWIKLDDQIAHHPKFMKAGPVAAWLWVCGNGYCNKFLTDGFIPTAAVKTLGGVDHATKVARVLADVGLWEKVEGGYRVHDFHDHNPTAAEVRARRTERSLSGRLGGQATAARQHSKNGGK
jgi:hypothetical protein